MNLRRGSTAKYDFIQRKSSMETWGGGGGGRGMEGRPKTKK